MPRSTGCEPLHERLGERLWIAPSCSLLHVPVDLDSEQKLDAEVKSWLAFALQKLDELSVLATALQSGPRRGPGRAGRQPGRHRSAPQLAARQQPGSQGGRRQDRRPSSASARAPMPSAPPKQAALLKLPTFPTTTIGSFPQTAEIRQARSQFKAGELDEAAYKAAMQAEIARSVREQEALGLDVLVHGEAERNDMVEYFGEQLDGYAFSQFGWVQSYGSRCVKPPILFGDISRPKADDGRVDQLRAVADRQADEGHADRPGHHPELVVRARRPAALGVLLPACAGDARRGAGPGKGRRARDPDRRSRAARRPAAAQVAVEGVPGLGRRIVPHHCQRRGDETQIHTHMCYSEFNDIIASIADMDADVITIETSRSDMELLDAFDNFKYPNEIGPGVYDIHSPNIPTQEHIVAADEEGGRAHSRASACGSIRTAA